MKANKYYIHFLRSPKHKAFKRIPRKFKKVLKSLNLYINKTCFLPF